MMFPSHPTTHTLLYLRRCIVVFRDGDMGGPVAFLAGVTSTLATLFKWGGLAGLAGVASWLLLVAAFSLLLEGLVVSEARIQKAAVDFAANEISNR